VTLGRYRQRVTIKYKRLLKDGKNFKSVQKFGQGVWEAVIENAMGGGAARGRRVKKLRTKKRVKIELPPTAEG